MLCSSDLELSRRLERAEGYACAEFARARQRLFPQSGAACLECAGAWAVFDGVDSPVTQTFGLGLFEELCARSLDAIERFFMERGAPVMHEVSPLAGVAALDLLCARGYRPIEISSVLYRMAGAEEMPAQVRVIGADERALWTEVNTRAWTHEQPQLREFLAEVGTLTAARHGSICFLASLESTPGAAAALSLHQGVALLAGAATVPELRRRGLQTALLQGRLHYAHEHGCDLAMMVAAAGSDSQRNAERQGFRVAYTRLKWQKKSAD